MKTTITLTAAAVKPIKPELEDGPGFTPGPWQCSPFLTPDKDDDPLGVYKLDIGEALQARYENCQSLEAGSDEELAALDVIHAENSANAALIARAPELIAENAKLREALASISENLQNRAMTTEQEHAFRYRPECESWRVYLNSLILCARNEARAALNITTTQRT